MIPGVFFAKMTSQQRMKNLIDQFLGASHLPSGKPTQNYGKSPFLMGKSTISSISMGHFNNSFLYVYQRVVIMRKSWVIRIQNNHWITPFGK